MPTVLVVILFAYFYVCTTLASEYTLARVRARSIHNRGAQFSQKILI